MEYIKTNIGIIPLSDYMELQAYIVGFDSYEEMKSYGFIVEVDKESIIKREI